MKYSFEDGELSVFSETGRELFDIVLTGVVTVRLLAANVNETIAAFCAETDKNTEVFVYSVLSGELARIGDGKDIDALFFNKEGDR
ncbi:MAG: hypothetical protein ACI4SS_03180, partial [Clostridia bacterium]